MTVDVGVAVPGKMLERRDHPAVARAGDVGADQRRDPRRILPVRAGVDDRVARVVVDVRDRREVHVDAERARLDAGDPRLFADQAHVVAVGSRRDRAHRHLPWKLRRAGDAEADAGLEVGRVQQRHRGKRLQAVEFNQPKVSEAPVVIICLGMKEEWKKRADQVFREGAQRGVGKLDFEMIEIG